MGETRPGDKIRRGSIRVRPTKPSPDLVLCGELGTELVVVPGFECVSDLLVGMDLGWEWERESESESERFSGLEGGTVNEQHHDLRRDCESRRDKPGFRRVEMSIFVSEWESRSSSVEALFVFCNLLRESEWSGLFVFLGNREGFVV